MIVEHLMIGTPTTSWTDGTTVTEDLIVAIVGKKAMIVQQICEKIVPFVIEA